MTQNPAPVRQDRLGLPAGDGVRETDEVMKHIRSAAKAEDELLANGRKFIEEISEELGASTEEDLEAVRSLWPPKN